MFVVSAGLLQNRHMIDGESQHDEILERTMVNIEPMPDVKIRLADASDAETIATVLYESFVEYESLYTPKGFAATSITSEEIVNRMREGPVWVAVRNEVIVGTASVVPKDESLYLRGMAVLPTARGQRTGELMLAQIEIFAVTEGLHRLFLSSTLFLDRAIRLYERFGFRRTGEGPHELFGTPLFTMEKAMGHEN